MYLYICICLLVCTDTVGFWILYVWMRCYWYACDLCLIYVWVQKGGEIVDCTGIDSYFTEAEGCSEGSLQEQEVLATWSAPQEDQSHSQATHQASGNPSFWYDALVDLLFLIFSGWRFIFVNINLIFLFLF